MTVISLIVCHHVGRKLLQQSIDSLTGQIKIDFEIIIATSDETLKEEFGPYVKVVHIPGGPAIKRNIAFRYACGNFIALFDDDIEAHPEAVLELYNAFDDETGMVFGKLKNMEHRTRFDETGGFLTPTGFIWSRAESGIEDTGQYEETEPIFAGKSASCMIRRKVYTEVGMFDPYFGILGEESDLAWRVWLAGYKVMYAPLSLTFHAFNTRYKPVDYYTMERVFFNGSRNYVTMLASNLEWYNLGILVPHILMWIISGIGKIMTGQFRAGFFIFKGLCHVSPYHIRMKREKVKQIRKVSDKLLLPQIMRSAPKGYYLKRLRHYLTSHFHG